MQTSRVRTELLWKEYLRDPSRWWDSLPHLQKIPRTSNVDLELCKISTGKQERHNDNAVERTHEVSVIDGPCKAQDTDGQEVHVMGASHILEEDIKEACYTTLRMAGLDDWLLSLANDLQPHPPLEYLTHVLYKCKEQGYQAHILRFYTCMCMWGLESQSSLGNHLVSILVELGIMHHAQQVFDKLVNYNELSSNSLVIGYVDSGQLCKAFTLHDKMQKDGLVCTRAHAFVALLKACTNLKDIKRGIGIHVEIARMGLVEKDLYIGSTLIDMYAKCGLLAKAQEAFDTLSVYNVICWTALLRGYVEHGYGEEALQIFEKMQENNMSPNAVTLICSLQACSKMGAVAKGQEIHCEIAKKGMLERDLVSSTIIDMYAKCGWLLEARGVFEKLPIKDSISYTALISGYAEHGQGEDALHCFKQMQEEGLSPDPLTFVTSLKACSSIGAADRGLEIHAEIARQGLHENNLFLGSTLVDMYAKWGLLTKAKEVFNNLNFQNVVSWTALIAGYAECGHDKTAIKCFGEMQSDGVSPNSITLACSMKACGRLGATREAQELYSQIESRGWSESDLMAGNTLIDVYANSGLLAKAHEVFDKLPHRNRASWNSLIAGYADYSCGEEALEYLEQMQNEGVCPDAITYVCSLKACGCIGARDKGQELHAEVVSKGLLEENLLVCNTLLDMYNKCGELASAQHVFAELPIRDVVSWNSIISGYAHAGECENAMINFDTMVKEGVKPNTITFLVLLNACNRASTFGKGQTYVEFMGKEYGFAPTIKHQTCIVGLYVNQGKVDKALGMIKGLPPCSPDVATWRSVLSACRTLGILEFGKQAFEIAVCG